MPHGSYKYMDDGNLLGTVFLDFKEAFAMGDHKLWCKKHQYYMISTSLRTQNVCIGNNISNLEPVKYGVTQGSILETSAL
jgi:hypothetical protein